MKDQAQKKAESAQTRRQLSMLALLLGIYACLILVTYAWFLPELTSSIPSISSAPLPAPPWVLGLANAGIVLVVYGGLSLLGYWLAHKLGWPGVFREHAGWQAWILRPAIIGILLGIALVVLDQLFGLLGAHQKLPHPPFPLSVLASASAGIGEELLFRLFVLSFWASLLQFLFGRWVHKEVVFWAANLLAALAFGAAHLPALMALSGVMSLAGISPLVLVEVFLLNGIIGLIAGVWYRRSGLIAASGIHFWADVVWHVIWPLLGFASV